MQLTPADNNTHYTLCVQFSTYLIGWVVLAIVIGSIPFGWLVGKLGGIDVTKLGSQNIGMTNVWRLMGWKAGVTVFILDMLKGLVPILALGYCQTHMPEGLVPLAWQAGMGMVIGLACVLGHTFSPWLKFKGGKGIATGCGVAIGLFGWLMIPVLLIFVATVAITRMISFSGLLATFFLLLFTVSIPDKRELWPFAVLITSLVFFTHRKNIGRLISGTESKFSFGKSKDGDEKKVDEETSEETGENSD